jgi:hypothetical protein
MTTIADGPRVGSRRIVHEVGKHHLGKEAIVGDHGGDATRGQCGADEFVRRPVAVGPSAAVEEYRDGAALAGVRSAVNIEAMARERSEAHAALDADAALRRERAEDASDGRGGHAHLTARTHAGARREEAEE